MTKAQNLKVRYAAMRIRGALVENARKAGVSPDKKLLSELDTLTGAIKCQKPMKSF